MFKIVEQTYIAISALYPYLLILHYEAINF